MMTRTDQHDFNVKVKEALESLSCQIATIRIALYDKGLVSLEEFDMYMMRMRSEMDQQQAHERSKN